MEGATATLHLLMQYYSYQAESNFASAAKHPCHLLIEKRLLRWFACPNVEELRLRGWGMQSSLPVASYHDCNYNYDSDDPGEKKRPTSIYLKLSPAIRFHKWKLSRIVKGFF